MNRKRVQRVRRMEGLRVSRKHRRMRRVGQSTAQRQRATHRGHVWSWDFVEDQTERGTRLRVLTLLDEHTRECLAVHVAWSIRVADVIRVVAAAMERHGVPGHLRSNNGPESRAGQAQCLRGQRVFCSNRGQRGGCGKTFALVLAEVLPSLIYLCVNAAPEFLD